MTAGTRVKEEERIQREEWEGKMLSHEREQLISRLSDVESSQPRSSPLIQNENAEFLGKS